MVGEFGPLIVPCAIAAKVMKINPATSAKVGKDE
jgi:hypothetical protein